MICEKVGQLFCIPLIFANEVLKGTILTAFKKNVFHKLCGWFHAIGRAFRAIYIVHCSVESTEFDFEHRRFSNFEW
jgi:hypothetical protein